MVPASRERPREGLAGLRLRGAGKVTARSAAWHYFNKPAFALTGREAALLAVTLPAPR
ncbi:MAG: monofunctional biosynthetic peptidoglycan transglycosylase, partial [Caulobacteraceae bacterium]